MKTIHIYNAVGEFGENKDVARDLRVKVILPELKTGREIVLDFTGVTSATQSFIHALISDPIRKQGVAVLDRMIFKNCNGTIQEIIGIVTDYMQEGAGT